MNTKDVLLEVKNREGIVVAVGHVRNMQQSSRLPCTSQSSAYSGSYESFAFWVKKCEKWYIQHAPSYFLDLWGRGRCKKKKNHKNSVPLLCIAQWSGSLEKWDSKLLIQMFGNKKQGEKRKYKHNLDSLWFSAI